MCKRSTELATVHLQNVISERSCLIFQGEKPIITISTGQKIIPKAHIKEYLDRDHLIKSVKVQEL